MGAAWYRARRAVRHRWPATLLLIALVGVAGGVVLTAGAGARRASTAYDRFRAETLAADLDIAFAGEELSEETVDARAEAVSELPEVEVLTRTAFPFVVPAGSGQYPFLDYLAIVGLDDRFTNDIERLRVVDGRLPDPQRADEIAVLRTYAEEAQLEVGDPVRFDSFTYEQSLALFEGGGGPPAGPVFTFVVTGVFDVPVAVSESTGNFVAKAMLSRAFFEKHGDRIGSYPGGFTVRLRNGARDVPAVSAAVRKIFAGVPELELTPAAEVDGKVDESIRVLALALLTFALIAALAGCVAIAQAIARHLSQDAVNIDALTTLGMTRTERVATLAATAAPVAIGGAGLAVVLAVLASPLMPIGVARRAEPDLGISLDWALLAGGAVCVAVLVMVFSVIAAVPLARDRTKAAGRTLRPAAAVRFLRRSGLRPQTEIGVAYALDPRTGTAWPVRSAILGVAFGAVGIAATIVFAASLSTLASSPNRYGAPWDALVSGFTGDVGRDVGAELVADDRTARVGRLASGIARVGSDESNVHSLRALKGAAPITLLDGRLPTSFGEAALGAGTLRDAGVRLGDDVTIVGAEGTGRVKVVGRVALPIIDERSGVDRGALVIDEQLREIITADERSVDLLVEWNSGVDQSSANEALSEQLDAEVFEPRMPAEVNNLRAVNALPWALAIFLALLATMATAHALVQTTRLRRRELAVLRTLGFERRQLSMTVSSQATTIALLGVVIGVPVGTLAGAVLWRSIAERVGVVDGPVVPVLALAALAVAIAFGVNLVALVPARRAGRVSPATLLRDGGA